MACFVFFLEYVSLLEFVSFLELVSFLEFVSLVGSASLWDLGDNFESKTKSSSINSILLLRQKCSSMNPTLVWLFLWKKYV